MRWIKEAITLLATFFVLIISILLFKHNLALNLPWVGFGMDFSLRLYPFSAFILLSISSFAALIALYSSVFMAGKNHLKQFYAYFLFTAAFASGAVLANNLILFLFFWEGLLLMLFGMIYIGGQQSFTTAIKAFIIVGVSDVCLMFGIALTYMLAGTFSMSEISLPLTGAGSAAFIFLMIGAIAKGGSMPFHSWIPDAAVDAPLPFMAFMPAALEKLLGIYFLTRISMDLFRLVPGSWVSVLLMSIGSIVIILAVMMALIQKDYKRLLSYHAISQVGYMILGIGTALPIGIVGGLFHMINNALYKCGLFLSGGAVEKQSGTTDLSKLGGLARKMPITFGCFFVLALSISGVPPFNGFFSKELVYDAALERGWIFYFVAALGSFFTAASFLKLGHAAYFDKLRDEHKDVKEPSVFLLMPMLVIALVCVLFGIFNAFPIEKLIQPALASRMLEGHHSFAGWPANWMLVIITALVLLAAILNHYYGVKRSGKGLGAVDHIHYAPGLAQVYDKAEKRWFDPFEIGLRITGAISIILWWFDRFVDWIYEVFTVSVTLFSGKMIRAMHNGNYSVYAGWSLVGAGAVTVFLLLR